MSMPAEDRIQEVLQEIRTRGEILARIPNRVADIAVADELLRDAQQLETALGALVTSLGAKEDENGIDTRQVILEFPSILPLMRAVDAIRQHAVLFHFLTEARYIR